MAIFKYIFTERESAMTDDIQLRYQLALAIVDLIWLKGKISDEERLKTRLLVIEKYARFEEKELILKKYKR